MGKQTDTARVKIHFELAECWINKESGGRKQKQVRFQEEKEQEERAKLKPKSKVHFLTAWGPDRFYNVFREQEL